MNMTRVALMAGVAFLICGVAQAETVPFGATLNGASEVPPKTTNGNGTAVASLDTGTKVLTYTIAYAQLTGPATAGHFHGPAEEGKNAGVAVPLSTPLASPIKGTATLTDAQVADLMAGRWYANVHTAANPSGEIRGQLIRSK